MTEDERQLLRLWIQVHGWHASRDPHRYQPVTERAFIEWHAWARQSHEFLTERIEGVIQGYAAVRVVSTTSNALVRGRTYGYLDQVVVDADHRNRGLGAQLVQRAILYSRERGAESMELDCRLGNLAADFFGRQGFHGVSQRMAISLVSS